MRQPAVQRRYVRLSAAINKKAQSVGSVSRITADDLAFAFIRTNATCPYCNIGIDPMHNSFDHVVPFDLGGPNDLTNVTACCMTCQRIKARKLVEEFYVARAVKSVCEICRKEFKPRWADFKRGYGQTCSRRCAGVKGKRAQTAS